MITRPLTWAGLTTLIACLIAAATGGIAGLRSAALAGVVICFTFAVTFWLRDLTSRWAPEAVMAVALASYGLKVMVLGVLLVVVGGATWLDRNSFSLTVFGVTIAWMVGIVTDALRHRTRIYDDAR